MRASSQVVVVAAVLAFAAGSQPASADEPVTRVSQGLQVLYDFASADGTVVHDRAGVGKPADLEIEAPEAVHRAAGSLEVTAEVLVRSPKPPRRLTEAVRRSREITLEAWICPANTQQGGPARIVTLSRNVSERNFTLGQDGDRFDVRLRSTKSSGNGLPSTTTQRRAVRKQLTHVVYTRDRRGRAKIFLDGKLGATRKVAGDLSNWDTNYRLALANEHGGGRPWLGTYHLVAVYSRSLSAAEVEQNFHAGPGGDTALAAKERHPGTRLFATKIAPLLSHHCLECHDSSTRKGKLDLSRKDKALAGGRKGPAIVPGQAKESLLFELVDSDDMPHDRPALSAQEKELIKSWIDGGAAWSLSRIDPAVYVHGFREGHDWLRRLTVSEYIETVKAAVGVDIEAEAREILPPDRRADGFSNTAYNLNVDLAHVEAFSRLAEIIVDRLDAVAFAARFSKSRRFTDDDMGKLISRMGKWLLRGPLEESEIVAYRGITTSTIAVGGDFEDAVRGIVEAMLQSPRFIYRIEDQHGGGAAFPVDDYELASRISYIVWGGPPDEALLRAAEEGELDEDSIQRHVERMLADPRAQAHSLRFASEWLHLERLADLRPSSEAFPSWNDALARDMRDETLAFFKEVVWVQKRPLSDLFNLQVTFATPRLAKHYGLPEAKSAEDGVLARYDLTAVPSRGGLLTQGSVLTIGGDEASMVTRGLFILKELLRGVVKDPPAGVDTTQAPTEPGPSLRAIAMDRIRDRSCGGCHGRFEPLAFALERFDGVGVYYERDEHGNELREDGEILFPFDAASVPFKSSEEFMNLLAESERVQESLTWKLTQFALGRPLVATDAASVEAIHKQAQEGGGTYQSLIAAIVKSDLVRFLRTAEEVTK